MRGGSAYGWIYVSNLSELWGSSLFVCSVCSSWLPLTRLLLLLYWWFCVKYSSWLLLLRLALDSELMPTLDEMSFYSLLYLFLWFCMNIWAFLRRFSLVSGLYEFKMFGWNVKRSGSLYRGFSFPTLTTFDLNSPLFLFYCRKSELFGMSRHLLLPNLCSWLLSAF